MNDQENLFGEADVSLVEGTSPDSTSHLQLETRKDFLAWHKPRKQWIRSNQWASAIGNLVDKLRLHELHEPLRYLSLPGPDLLDVRSIYPVCSERQVQLQFVGLNGGDDDSDIALNRVLENQVRALPGVHPGSEVVKDRFEHLGVQKTVAYSRIITAQRSFDVINVDLCGSFAESVPKAEFASIPSALLALISHQLKSRSKDWLLFITTRSDHQAVNRETMTRFVSWINSEIDAGRVDKDRLVAQGLIKEAEFQSGHIVQDLLSPQSHSNAFALGFGHWVLGNLSTNNPPWRADMLEHIEYHVAMTDPTCDMVSLGFWCRQMSQQNAPDLLGIANEVRQGESPTEVVIELCKQKIEKKVGVREDLDIKLHLDEVAYNLALDQSADLLAGAMYDVDAYRVWSKVEKDKITKFLTDMGLA